MNIFKSDNKEFVNFIQQVEQIVTDVSKCAKEDVVGLDRLIINFKIKTQDFYRENRK